MAHIEKLISQPHLTQRVKPIRTIRAAKLGRGDMEGLVAYVTQATPLEMVALERSKVPANVLKQMAVKMRVPQKAFFLMVGIPKSTAEKALATKSAVSGSVVAGMARLLAIAREIVDASTASEAKTFDAAKWLGEWIQIPQRSLGGKRPADLLDTPTGVEIVARTLGAVQSGSYL